MPKYRVATQLPFAIAERTIYADSAGCAIAAERYHLTQEGHSLYELGRSYAENVADKSDVLGEPLITLAGAAWKGVA